MPDRTLKGAPILLALFLTATSVLAARIDVVSQFDPWPGVRQYANVWGDGHHAYVGSLNRTGVAIIDLSRPSSPVLSGYYDSVPGGQFKEIAVRQGIGFFASDEGNGLHIVSVTNPAAPVFLTRITSAQNGFDSIHTFFLALPFLYEASFRSPVVKVFDVSLPASPRFVRDIVCTDPSVVHQVTVIRDRLYASGWSGNTDIFDVSNIGTQPPLLMGTVDTGAASHSSWATEDGKILVSTREIMDGDVRIYDIGNPARPVLLSTLTAGSLGIAAASPHNPVIVGKLLLISWYQAGLVALDIGDPARPLLVGTFDTFSGDSFTNIGGNWGVDASLGLDKVLLSDRDGGLFVVDVSKLAGPDQDGDRLPDDWEAQNRLSPIDARDAAMDPDGDGLSNLQEYLAGTNPRDALSTLRITSMEKTSSTVRLHFPAVDGMVYRVEKTEGPALKDWAPLPFEVRGSNGSLTVTDADAGQGAGRFYRVRVRP